MLIKEDWGILNTNSEIYIEELFSPVAICTAMVTEHPRLPPFLLIKMFSAFSTVGVILLDSGVLLIDATRKFGMSRRWEPCLAKMLAAMECTVRSLMTVETCLMDVLESSKFPD